jgi:hypothetical protein
MSTNVQNLGTYTAGALCVHDDKGTITPERKKEMPGEQRNKTCTWSLEIALQPRGEWATKQELGLISSILVSG